MEVLPDELLLLIFRYLHKFDILYSFSNLNQRFQQIIAPYFQEIDLTQADTPSYKQFSLFLTDILAGNEHGVHSLKLDGRLQMHSFHSHILHLINLKSLTLKLYAPEHSYHNLDSDVLNRCLTETLKLPSLSELSVYFEGRSDLTFMTIATCASSNLKTLTILNPDGNVQPCDISQMVYLKRFSVCVNSITSLAKILKIMPNLEELNLSIFDLVNGIIDLHLLKLPKTLEKLHLEMGPAAHLHSTLYPNIERTRKFLDLFRYQLRSLTLVIITPEKQFSHFDKFNSLVSHFTQLQTFQYYINSEYQPDSLFFSNVKQLSDSCYSIFTVPQPQQFHLTSTRAGASCYLDLPITLQKLYNCMILSSAASRQADFPITLSGLKDDFMFVHLKKIVIYTISEAEATDTLQFFSKLITLSPNLNSLLFYNYHDTDSMSIIRQLKKLLPMQQAYKITHFEYSMQSYVTSYHKTYLQDLSEILPHLKALTFIITQQFIDEYLSTLVDFLQDIRNYFQKLSYLKLCLSVEDKRKQCIFESYKKVLDEIHLTDNSLDYTVYGYDLNIWL